MIHREDGEQRAVIAWAKLVSIPPGLALYVGAKLGDYLFAIPNGGARNRTEASRLVGLGVRAGVSDLFFSFPSPDTPYKHGLYIEMKAQKPHGKAPSAHQKVFTERMLAAGYGATVCYGFDEARQAFSDYLMCKL